jgi:uncharacterized protein (DUF433 family)
MNVIGDMDPRVIPVYRYSDVARYVGIPASTVRSWVRGTTYATRAGVKRPFLPIIERPDESIPLLSFTNLVEVHVLSAMRNIHAVSLQRVRQALVYIGEQFPTEHPLASVEFCTDHVNLFVDVCGRILSVSGERGQIEIRRVVEAYLSRIERDEAGLAIRLYPFTRPADGSHRDGTRVVVIDPRLAFGRPTLVGTGIPTAVLAERFKAGESIADLSRDFRCPNEMIEEAIRCEHTLAA